MRDIEAALEWAQDLADGLPEKYQQVAFAELLRYALSTSGTATSDTAQRGSVNLEPWQQNLIDNLPPDSLVASKGSRAQQAMWAVITLLGVGEEATVDSVCELIRQSLGVIPEGKTNASHTLRNLTPKFTMREEGQTGRGYAYTPTASALEVFEGLVE